MELGTYLRNLRKEKGLTLREAAKRSGVSHPYLSQIETGKNDNPGLEILMKLAKLYDQPLEDFLRETGHIQTVAVGYYDDIKHYIDEENELRKKKDISHLLQNKDDNVYYNGKMLSPEERQKAITVLSAIFD